MSHAITLGGLLGTIGIMAGVALCAGGVIAFLAGSMSDAPQAGDDAAKQGCVLGVIGLALLALSTWAIFA